MIRCAISPTDKGARLAPPAHAAEMSPVRSFMSLPSRDGLPQAALSATRTAGRVSRGRETDLERGARFFPLAVLREDQRQRLFRLIGISGQRDVRRAESVIDRDLV